MRYLGVMILMVIAATMVASTAVAQPATAPATPTQRYLEYRAVFEKATSVEAIFPFIEPDAITKMKALPKAEAAQMWMMMKAMDTYTGIKVLKETIKGDTCVLEIEATKPDKTKVTGTVDMKKRATWLLVQENLPM